MCNKKIFNEFEYVIDNDSIIITRQRRKESVAKIPEEIEGKKVIGIMYTAFQDCRKLEKIILPKTIKVIGYGTFLGCEKLVTIEIDKGNTVFNFEKGVLFEKKNIHSYLITNKEDFYKIPSGTQVILPYAFCENMSLKAVAIPDSEIAIKPCHRSTKKTPPTASIRIQKSVTDIKESAFQGCKNLEQINLPDSLKRIEKKAFLECTSLKQITIPKNVKVIGNGAFFLCDNLKEIVIDNDNQTFVFQRGTLVDVKTKTIISYFESNTKTTFCIPDGISIIRKCAFINCNNLKTIIFPPSVKIIESDAFQLCEELASVTLPNTIKKIEKEAFSGCEKLTFVVEENSAAHKFAIQEKIPFEFFTTQQGDTQ